MGSRRGSISSLSSVTSMLEEKDDEKIRCCHHCMDTLLKRQQKLEEKDHVPDIVKLYEVKSIQLAMWFFSFSCCLEFTLLYPSCHSFSFVFWGFLLFTCSKLVFLSEAEDVHAEGG